MSTPCLEKKSCCYIYLRRNKLALMSRFMEIKSKNPKLTQKQLAKNLGYSDSTIER